MAETPVWRPTARLLVVDPDSRVLLFSSADAGGRTWWFTPGGGVHRGETVTAAAVRELSEETGFGCTEAELGPVVATSAGLWKGEHDGTLFLGAHSFFFLRVPQPVIDTDGQEEFERSFITGHRWWTLGELRETTDEVLPHTLVDLIDRLVRGGIPSRPIRLPRGLGGAARACRLRQRPVTTGLSATPSTRTGTCRLRQRHRLLVSLA